MRFLIDENVRKEVINFLKTSGYDILLVTAGSKDETIAKLAQESQRIILTQDQHFADILMYPPQEYSGIIRIKIHPPTTQAIIKALKESLPNITPDRINKRLVILEQDGYRIK